MNVTNHRWNSAVWPDEPLPSSGPDPAELREPTPAPPSASTSLDDPELATLVGAGAAFQGTLSLSGNIRIDGSLFGTLIATGLVVLGETARITGQIKAKSVVILGGVVEADVVAEDSIEIRQAAVVRGDLRSPQIYMDRGVRFTGTCDMSEAPSGSTPSAPETR